MAETSTLDKAKILADNGWDKGFVYFGFPATESTVKVVTAVLLVSQQDNFPYSKEEGTLQHVVVNFDDKPIAKNDETGEVSLGVYSPEYGALSDGKTYMPAIAVDGKLTFESGDIVQYLNETYPDDKLSAEDKKAVDEWIAFNKEHNARLFEALKHFGWCFMQGDKPNYVAYGKGKKDLEWEKKVVGEVHAFFAKIDQHFADKADNNPAYYVGDRLTLADCVMLNWPWSFHLVTELNVEKRYPNAWKHALALKEKGPPGAEAHYNMFPFFAKTVADLGKEAREKDKFHIENDQYWTS